MSEFLRKFGSYFIVGGLATIVEWIFYYLFDPILHLNTYLAVALAFIFSTFANWYAGRKLTFKNAPKQNLSKELSAIYTVSIIGLCLNWLIMYLLLNFIFAEQTDEQKMISKIIATGVVFFWNFLIRDKLIYKDKK